MHHQTDMVSVINKQNRGVSHITCQRLYVFW